MDYETKKQIIFLFAIVIGQILMVLVPYLNKQKEDGRKFDINYLYTAVLGYLSMAVVSLQSETIMNMDISVMNILLLMFGSAAIQKNVIASITPKQKKK